MTVVNVVASTYFTFHSIQFAGAVGVSNCPGAPQLDFFLGRPARKQSFTIAFA